MNKFSCLVLYLFFLFEFKGLHGIWWNLALDQSLLEVPLKATDDTEVALNYCQKYRGSLSVGQMKLCQLYVDHMTYIARGSKLAIIECQHQFRYSQWNCSTISNQSVYGNVIQNMASRETSFVNAITAAGVLQAISRSCRNGDLSSCGCSTSGRPANLNKDWIWGGCGDNVEYGYKFTKQFIDLIDKSTASTTLNRKQQVSNSNNNGEDGNIFQNRRAVNIQRRLRARRLMNLHNNEAGRRAVYKFVKVECKCHGVSGSCSMKTCWLKLASFREIGDLLKEKYDSAIEVKFEQKQNQLRVRHKRFSRPTREDLVYIEESPNFCNANSRLETLGTRGRQCNKNSNAPDSCRIMCCGRGYYIKKHIKEEKCKCKFQWCCSVKCETCITEIETYICK